MMLRLGGSEKYTYMTSREIIDDIILIITYEKFTQIITIQNIAKHNRPLKNLIRHDDIELTVVLIT